MGKLIPKAPEKLAEYQANDLGRGEVLKRQGQNPGTAYGQSMKKRVLGKGHYKYKDAANGTCLKKPGTSKEPAQIQWSGHMVRAEQQAGPQASGKVSGLDSMATGGR